MAERIKFHLDENVSNAVGEGLRRRGIEGEHLTFVASIYTYYNKSYISVLLAKIGFSNWDSKARFISD